MTRALPLTGEAGEHSHFRIERELTGVALMSFKNEEPMDWENLRIFLAVAEAGSLAGANGSGLRFSFDPRASRCRTLSLKCSDGDGAEPRSVSSIVVSVAARQVVQIG